MQWESIGKSAAGGNSNKILSYGFTDPFPSAGINYYQLVEYDFDGAHQESKIIFITYEVKEETHLAAYPNPVSTYTTFNFYSEKSEIYYLKGFTMNGEEIYAAKVFGIPGENRFKFSLENFSVGVYSFQLSDENGKIITAIKVVKVD